MGEGGSSLAWVALIIAGALTLVAINNAGPAAFWNWAAAGEKETAAFCVYLLALNLSTLYTILSLIQAKDIKNLSEP